MHISWFLAKKFLSGAAKETNIMSMLRICFLSISIGTFSLALVGAIMNGFEKETYKKLQGINSDLIIRSREALNFEKIKQVIKSEFQDQIEEISPNIITQLIVKSEASNSTSLIAVKAIDPKTAIISSRILDSISKNPQDIEKLLSENSILVGQSLADQLDIIVEDKVDLLFAPQENFSGNKITLSSESAKISGIFKTGIDEIDSNLAIMSISALENILPEAQINLIEIKLKTNININKIKNRLENRLNLAVFSWQDLYPSLVSALVLEKYAMIFILALITLIASMNLISLIFMYINQKRVQIAILKSLGMEQKNISRVFIIIGMTISLLACFTGLVFAHIAVYILNRYPFIKLPDAYYVTYLPAQMDLKINLIVIIIVIVLSFIASLYPSRTTKQISIANILKFESL